jgi:hypothetical protein
MTIRVAHRSTTDDPFASRPNACVHMRHASPAAIVGGFCLRLCNDANRLELAETTDQTISGSPRHQTMKTQQNTTMI